MSVDYDDARSLNPFFARNTSPPWGQRLGAVLTVLGLGGTSPSLEVFADAVYDWETANALPNPNGILDQNAWAAMEPVSRICVEQPPIPLSWLAPVGDSPDDPIDVVEIPMSGAIPLGAGLPSVVRIPVPGSGNLAIEFFPRNFKGKSTSTLFIQNMKGNKTLRLDYGFNKTTGTVDYHWNQKGTHAKFGIADHTTVGKAGQIVYKGAKYFRYAGRALVVLGTAIDVVHVVQSSNPLRTATAKVTAWALAAAGCKSVGYLGAAGGTAIQPGLGTAAGGVAGCIVGGIGGYYGGERVGEVVYDWAEGTIFTQLDRIVP